MRDFVFDGFDNRVFLGYYQKERNEGLGDLWQRRRYKVVILENGKVGLGGKENGVYRN